MIKKFCPEQTKCKEDTEDTWTCIAHWAEGHIRECPYDNYTESQEGKYPCIDAKIGQDNKMKR